MFGSPSRPLDNPSRLEQSASRLVAELAAADDPGIGLARDEARRLRDERIQTLKTAKAEAKATGAELARRETQDKQNVFSRIFATEAQNKRRRENTPTDAEAERRDFHRELAEAQAKRNAEDLARRNAAGLVWEPTGPAGGYEVAAVFSSAELWDATEEKIVNGALHEPTFHNRDIVHLHWCLNVIAASGGSATVVAGPGRAPAHWSSYDRVAADGILFREDSLRQIEKLGYVTVTKGAGNMTLTFGPRTVALTKTFLETIRK